MKMLDAPSGRCVHEKAVPPQTVMHEPLRAEGAWPTAPQVMRRGYVLEWRQMDEDVTHEEKRVEGEVSTS